MTSYTGKTPRNPLCRCDPELDKAEDRMRAPLSSPRPKAVIIVLLLFSFCLAPLLSGRPAHGATVSWVTPPPSRIASGQSFTVRWRVSGARSFDAAVHWDPTDPGGPGKPNGAISPTCDDQSTSCSTDQQRGKTSATLTAPTTSPTGFPVVLKYLAHIQVQAGGATHAFTDARSVTVDPILGPPTVTIAPPSVDFGKVPVGSCGAVSLAIQHVPGTAPASGSISAGPDPALTISSGNRFSVSDGQSVEVEVRFCPTGQGSFHGSAVVDSPGTTVTNTETIPLQGVGFTPSPPSEPALSAPPTSPTIGSYTSYPVTDFHFGPYRMVPGPAGCGFVPRFPWRSRVGW